MPRHRLGTSHGTVRVRPRSGGEGGLGARLAAGACIAVLVLGCSRDKPPGPARSGEEPQQITRNFTTTETDSGQTRFVFKAQVARIYAGNVTRAEKIQVDFYDRGRQVSVLTAREGFLDSDGRMTARGDAKVVSTEGAVLQTETLYWDRGRQKIRSDDFVRVTKGRDVLTGTGLTTGPNLDLIEIDHDVNATVVGKPEGKSR